MTPLRRRVARLAQPTAGEWAEAWDRWCLRVVRCWRQHDSQGRAHHALALTVEREWAGLASAEEEAEFLARGEALAVRYGLPPELWAWFWRDAYGARLRGDLGAWPQVLAEPPAVEGHVLAGLVAQAQDAEACALVMAAVAAVALAAEE